MSTAAVRETADHDPKAGKANGQFDPDEFRMTIGEHLEELRKRLLYAIVGFVVVGAVCLVFGQRVMTVFCAPLFNALVKYQINPQLIVDELGEGFMVYIEISLISAAALASPWIVYQLWQFVAAGLYPHERKYVTKYLPFSILLLILGMAFLYFVVLPITLEFFVGFSIGPSIPVVAPPEIDPTATGRPPVLIPVFKGDPAQPVDGQI